MKNDRFDMFISEALEKKAESIGSLPFTAEQIKSRAAFEKRKEQKYMKFSKTKKLAVVCVLCFASITCFAAAKLSGSRGSSTVEFYNIDEISEYSKKVGFSPKYVDEFDNGFAFENGGTGTSQGTDENGKPLGKEYKDISLTYRDSSNNWVVLEISNGNPYADSGEYKEGYSKQTMKFVPANYVLTEEDKKAQEDGSISISYGTDKVEINEMESYLWKDGNLYYSLTSSNCNFGSSGMEDMAKQIQEQ